MKDPDFRYRSATGLKADLTQCQQALQVLGADGRPSAELIPSFPIAMHDKFSEFTLPNMLCGRTKEVEIIKSVIKRISSTHSIHYSGGGRQSIIPNSSSGAGQTKAGSVLTPRTPVTDTSRSSRGSDKASSKASNPKSEDGSIETQQEPKASASPGNGGSHPFARLRRDEVIEEEREEREGMIEGGERVDSGKGFMPSSRGNTSGGTHSSLASGGSAGRAHHNHGNTKERLASARAIVVSGARGVGKSSLVLECQTAIRTAGF